MSVLESAFYKVAGLQLYKKKIPRQEFSYEYCKIFKKVLYQTLPVATFGFSNQLRIFQEIATLKFKDNMPHNPISVGMKVSALQLKQKSTVAGFHGILRKFRSAFLKRQ